jgi:hypothetical protein
MMVSVTWPLTELVPAVAVMDSWMVAPAVVVEHVCETEQPALDEVQFAPASTSIASDMMSEKLSFAATVSITSAIGGQSAVDPLCTV